MQVEKLKGFFPSIEHLAPLVLKNSPVEKNNYGSIGGGLDDDVSNTTLTLGYFAPAWSCIASILLHWFFFGF